MADAEKLEKVLDRIRFDTFEDAIDGGIFDKIKSSMPGYAIEWFDLDRQPSDEVSTVIANMVNKLVPVMDMQVCAWAPDVYDCVMLIVAIKGKGND